jgi:hypothetical protein
LILHRLLKNSIPIVLMLFMVQLMGCTTSPGTQAVFDAVGIARGSISGKGATKLVNLDPRYKYLRVVWMDQEIYMARGYTRPGPDGVEEGWYTAKADLMKLVSGRLMGIYGAEVEWLGVTYQNMPKWEGLGSRTTIRRIRDVAPGYRYGLKETIEILRLETTPVNRIVGLDPTKLFWFEERIVEGEKLPPSRYALDKNNSVVYSELCIAPGNCLSWQVWPPASKDGQ